MSNYPAGVTGFEPQIAGADVERDESWTVGNCRMIGEHVIVQTGEHAQAGVVCTFEGGDVEGWINGDRALVNFEWECPVCGTENTVTDIDASEFERTDV